MSHSCRLLPFLSADGYRNMAADEALLEVAVAGAASLRFYVWSEATVSLGYFQHEQVRRDDPRLAALPYVRRPTGGMTLVHHHELTYALALPASPPWQVRGQDPWLCRMHAIIGAALRDWKIESRPAACAVEAHSATPLCFQHLTAGDLLINGTKIAGSAQRRQRGSLLQHGSVLLAASPAVPQLVGIRELSAQQVPVDELMDAIVREWSRDTGWLLTPADWTEAEEARIADLVGTKYSQDAWNRKR
jgi:lipoate-protein ligase A